MTIDRCSGAGKVVGACAVLVCAGALGASVSAPILVGWHDEMKHGASQHWRWDPPRGAADLSEPRLGVLRLQLGDPSESGQTPDNPPRTYYWASAYRYLTVDLDRYPILAVLVVGVHGKQ